MNPPSRPPACCAAEFLCIEPLEGRIAPAAVVKLGELDGFTGFEISGLTAEDQLGFSVSQAGDVNGDGFGDVIVGARGADPHGEGSGSVYVLFGKADGFYAHESVTTLDGSNGFRIDGVGNYDAAGGSVSGAGDVNGDGFADLLIGSYADHPSGGVPGAAYVVFGKASGFAATLNLSALDGSNGFRLTGTLRPQVSGAGDVNGDGYDDVIVGDYAADSSVGAAYVLFGQATGVGATLDVSALNGSNGFKLAGEFENNLAGRSVSGAGDVNGDGFDDVIVGAPMASPHGLHSGASYVVFGKAANFAASLNLGLLDGTNGFRLGGVRAYDNAGFAVSGAGDMNGDGFADVVIGAPGADPHGSVSGAAYVVFGKASGFAADQKLGKLTGADGFKLSGPSIYDRVGFSVSDAGDLNGDGFADIIVGAPENAPFDAPFGLSYVVFGKAGGFAANLNLARLDGGNGFKLKGETRNDFAGRAVSGAGDVNGDGFADLIVGAHHGYAFGTYAGSSYVIFGGPGVQLDRETLVVTELDGDVVTLRVTRGEARLIEIVRDGDGAIEKIDLTQLVLVSRAIDFSLAVSTPRGAAGDGQVTLAQLDGSGVHFHSIKVEGNVGQLLAGAGAGESKVVKITGDLGGAGQASDIKAAVGHLAIGGNLVGDLSADAFREIRVGGNIAGGALHAAGTIGSLFVRGAVTDSQITVLGHLGAANAGEAVALQRLKIGGDFVRSQLLAGYDASGAALNADVGLGPVTIRGNFEESSLVAGATAGENALFGDEDDEIIAGGGAVVARIAAITIKGTVLGSAAMGDHFGIVAEEIGKLKIGGSAQTLTAGPANDLTPFALGGTSDVKAREVTVLI